MTRTTGGIIFALAALAGATPPSARGQETQPAKPRIALQAITEDHQKVIRATVTLDGKPLENATVAFYVKRTFGDMLIGQDQTLDDGTAAVPFPAGLPGDKAGILLVSAEVKAPLEHAAAGSPVAIDGGRAAAPEENPFPRALWAPRAPLALIAVIAVAMAGVWCAYAYVVSLILKIRKGGSQ